MHVPARGTRLSAITPATSEARLLNAHHCKSTRVVSRALVSTGNSYLDKRAVKQELLSLVKQLGSTAILPGKQQEKARVNSLIGQLKQLSTGVYEEQLYGSWELLYASQGTAVTRTGLGGAMITAGARLPGVGIDSIKQILQQDGAGRIVALNEAQFGFGPFGSWEVAIEGHWKTQRTGDISTVKVVFEKFKVKPVGLMGRPLPPWLPQFVSSLGQGEETRGGAEWLTPYLDTDLRVGQGKAGNLFLFRKLD